MVLVLSTLHNLLTQLLSSPELHTAVLLTPGGQLISVAADASRPKDEARIVAGVSAEVWQETRQQGYGMVESELGRIFVSPIARNPGPETDEHEPLLLLALNATESVDWEDLQERGRILVDHLAPTLDKFRDYSRATKSSAMASPDRTR